jgi:hypothetical protein
MMPVEQGPPHPTPTTQDFGGIITLHINPDGTARAVLSRTSDALSRRLAWKLDEKEHDLSIALGLISDTEELAPLLEIPGLPEAKRPSIFAHSSQGEPSRFAQALHSQATVLASILAMFRRTIGDELALLYSLESPPKQRAHARKLLAIRFKNVLCSLEYRSAKPNHKSATFIKGKHGQQMPLSWVALETARQFVEQYRRLPTKAEVRQTIESKRGSPKVSRSNWSAAFKEAGLDILPRSKAHTF